MVRVVVVVVLGGSVELVWGGPVVLVEGDGEPGVGPEGASCEAPLAGCLRAGALVVVVLGACRLPMPGCGGPCEGGGEYASSVPVIEGP